MTRIICICCALLALSAVSALAGGTTMTIRDYIGVEWSDELVHYPLTFKAGDLKGDAVVQVKANGTAIPSQLSDVVRYPDGSVQSCNVWFFANIPAEGAVEYTVTPGKPGPKTNGVKAKVTDEAVEITTDAPKPVGIRLLNGAKTYAWPIAATDAPGPVQGLLLPSGRWIGKGRFEVPFKVKSYETEIIAEGPLFAEARVKYLFDTGYWTFTARVVQGNPMVIISEEMDTGWNAQNWDDVDRFYSMALNTGEFKPTQAFYLGRSRGSEYSSLLKDEAQDELKAVMHQPSTSGTLANGYPLSFAQDRTDYYMVGWANWSSGVGVGARFIEPGGDAVGFVAIDTPYWRNQMAVRFRVNTKGELLASLPIQVYEQGWPTDGYGRISPNATGKTLYVPETTARRKYGIMLTPAENEVEKKLGSLLRASAKIGNWPLDEVKDWVLDWPDPMADAGWAVEQTENGKTILDRMRKWVAAKRATGNFGIYSMHDYFIVSQWRCIPRGMGQADLADIINDTKTLTAEDRKTLRRLAAYQAYVMNSEDVFPWGAGSHLGNPNMSIMAMNTRTFASEMIKDHPMYTEWGQWTLAFTKNYIERFTRDSGAPYECPSYTLGVTWKQMADANKILMDAGIGDAFEGESLKKSVRFAFNWLLPHDLRFSGYRTIMPIGNTSYQSVTPDMARSFIDYYRERDPELAGQIQWFANQTLPDGKKLELVEDIMPELTSGHYEDYGVFFRHGFNTPYETYFHMMAGNCLGHYEQTDHMTYTLYAKGHPINLHFGNGYFPMFGRPWLRNRVSIDHRRDWSYERLYARVETAAFSKQADYVHAAMDTDELLPECPEYPTPYGTPDTLPMAPIEKIPLMTWHRQVLFMKDEDPKGPNYFVVRDTFDGRPIYPTDVSFWFLANGMEQLGDVYHFDGQLPVDMDVFVNEPKQPEFETGEFSHPQQPYARMVPDDLKYNPGKKRQEKQLYFRLKQSAGEGYMVVLYPRLKQNDPPAKFTRLDESVVKVETALSTDYIILNSFPVSFRDDDIYFVGRAGSVRRFKDGKVVVANTEGMMAAEVAGKTIAGDGPFTVTIVDGKVTVAKQSEDTEVEVK